MFNSLWWYHMAIQIWANIVHVTSTNVDQLSEGYCAIHHRTISQAIYSWYECKNHHFKTTTPPPSAQWVNMLLLPDANPTHMATKIVAMLCSRRGTKAYALTNSAASTRPMNDRDAMTWRPDSQSDAQSESNESLTHWTLSKMAAILQTAFSNTFPKKKIFISNFTEVCSWGTNWFR